jgi:hypothetical protein
MTNRKEKRGLTVNGVTPKSWTGYKIKFFVRELGIPPGSFHLTCFLFSYCCSNECILLMKRQILPQFQSSVCTAILSSGCQKAFGQGII